MSGTPSTRVADEEELDFLSERFDARKALYTDGLRPPRPQAPFFNNLSECARLVPGSPDDVRAPTTRRPLVAANIAPAAAPSAPLTVIRPSAPPVADKADEGSSASQRGSDRRTTVSANASEYLGRLAGMSEPLRAI